MRRTTVLITLLALVLLISGCSGDTGAPFTNLATGYYSQIDQPQAILITDQAAWQAHWQKLSEAGAPPAVDFATHSVLAVHLGSRGSGGYGVEIAGVRIQGDSLTLTAREIKPQPGQNVTDALTQPYQIIKIPRLPAAATINLQWQ